MNDWFGSMPLLSPQANVVSSYHALVHALSEEAGHEPLMNQIRQLLAKAHIPYGAQRDEAALELLHATLARAWELRERYDPDKGQPGGWIHGIALNVVYEHLRQARRFPQQLPADSDDWEHLLRQADDHSQKVLDRDFLTSIQEELEEHERELLRLCYCDDLNHQTIARQLNIKEGTVRTRLSRLLKKLEHIASIRLKEGSS